MELCNDASVGALPTVTGTAMSRPENGARVLTNVSSNAAAPASSSTIRIEGVSRLRGAAHSLGGDYIEAGSWAVVGAITGGHIDVGGTRPIDMEVASR